MSEDNTPLNIKDYLNYKLHLTVLLIVLISQYIGVVKFSLFNTIPIIILPMIFALFFSVITFVSKKITWITIKESKSATVIFMIAICPLAAKLAIISGQNIHLLYNTGPLILLKEIGIIGSIFIGLPIALLLGFKKESIGMTSSICREPQMSIVINKYGVNAEQTRGFMIVYLIGLVLGTVFMSIIVNVLSFILPFHPYAYALATGVGSSSMSVAGLTTLTVLHPQLADKLTAFSALSNIISLILTIYIFIFVSLPLTEKLYDILEHKLNSYIENDSDNED